MCGEPRSEHAFRTGQVLHDRWQIGALLGLGASASVYEARHRNGNHVAVKVLHESLSAFPSEHERLYAEARIGNLLDHPNIVSFYDEGVTEDCCPFLVMELVSGESVDQKLSRGPLSCVDALRIADCVLDALVAAHDAGIYHLDIKPGNIVCAEDGNPRLLDFGIALTPAGRLASHGGTAMGTPAFMPPEQARAEWERVGARSDLWSLGATIFTMVAGRTVRLNTSVEEELAAAASGAVPSLASVAAAPPAVVALVDRALQFEPSRRFASAREMRSAVQRVLRDLDKSPNAKGAAHAITPGPPPDPDETDVPRSALSSHVRAVKRRPRSALVLGLPTAIAAALALDVGPARDAQSHPVHAPDAAPQPAATSAQPVVSSWPSSSEATTSEPRVTPLTTRSLGSSNDGSTPARGGTDESASATQEEEEERSATRPGAAARAHRRKPRRPAKRASIPDRPDPAPSRDGSEQTNDGHGGEASSVDAKPADFDPFASRF